MLRTVILQNALIAALAASVLGHTPALAKGIDPSPDRSHSPAATAPRTWSPPGDLPAYPTPKAQRVQPGQPTWPTNPEVLTPPRPEGSVRGGSTDNDDIWLVVGIGLGATALAGGAAGAARHSRLRARRVAV